MVEMTKPQNNKLTIDEQLADFADSILNDKKRVGNETPFAPDPELRALEQIALRLRNTFPQDDPNEVVFRRMHRNIVTQWQQQESKKSEPFWKKWMRPRPKWQSQYSRQRLSATIFVTALVVFLLVSIFFLNGPSLNQPAATGHNLGAGLLVIFGGLILLAVWYLRRKR
jgi:hypothetical protein